jgi:hypothetical protein
MALNIPRCRRLIENAIRSFALDLSGLVVLTEAATNHFSLTPLIAALAGADRVIAVGQDSRYGSLAAVKDELLGLASVWEKADRIVVIGDRRAPALSQADIVTNLGFVRPLDAAFLAQLKPGVSVSLMWETWEFRPQDLDIQACRRLGISVLGTNEEHPDLEIFTYLGQVAMKLLFELDVEVFRSRIVVIGSGKFAASICQGLLKSGAEAVEVVSPERGMKRHECFRKADAIVVVEHRVPDMLLGPDGWLDPRWLAEINPGAGVAHICGKVDQSSLALAGLRHTPSRLADAGYMSVTTDYVGPRPLIDLHVVGLKVGEMLARCRSRGLSALESELEVLRSSPLAQGFNDFHTPLLLRQPGNQGSK